jgi:type IV secretory pathway component VirB8
MSGCDGQYERVCKDEFASIHTKLDRLDEAIRGNGKPGIQLRLDRLEAAERSRTKLIWIIVGAAATLAIAAVWQQVFGG